MNQGNVDAIEQSRAGILNRLLPARIDKTYHFASPGKQAGVFNDTVYALIIAMSLITSIIAPPILKCC